MAFSTISTSLNGQTVDAPIRTITLETLMQKKEHSRVRDKIQLGKLWVDKQSKL